MINRLMVLYCVHVYCLNYWLLNMYCTHRCKYSQSGIGVNLWKISYKMASRYCSVNLCNSNSDDKTISLFSFPSGYSKEWISVVSRGEDWLPEKNTKICSKHFAPHMINNKRLLPGAVPLLNSSSYTSISVKLGNYNLEIHRYVFVNFQKTVAWDFFTHHVGS